MKDGISYNVVLSVVLIALSLAVIAQGYDGPDTKQEEDGSDDSRVQGENNSDTERKEDGSDDSRVQGDNNSGTERKEDGSDDSRVQADNNSDTKGKEDGSDGSRVQGDNNSGTKRKEDGSDGSRVQGENNSDTERKEDGSDGSRVPGENNAGTKRKEDGSDGSNVQGNDKSDTNRKETGSDGSRDQGNDQYDGSRDKGKDKSDTNQENAEPDRSKVQESDNSDTKKEKAVPPTQCPTGQVFCFRKEKCVSKEEDCPYNRQKCGENQVYCLSKKRCVDKNCHGGKGGQACSTNDTCNGEGTRTCEEGQVWCKTSGSCLVAEWCSDGKNDTYLVRIPMISKETFLDVTFPRRGQMTLFGDGIEKFAKTLQKMMQQQFSAHISVNDLTLVPGGAAAEFIVALATIRSIADSTDENKLKNMVPRMTLPPGLTLSSTDPPLVHVLNKAKAKSIVSMIRTPIVAFKETNVVLRKVFPRHLLRHMPDRVTLNCPRNSNHNVRIKTAGGKFKNVAEVSMSAVTQVSVHLRRMQFVTCRIESTNMSGMHVIRVGFLGVMTPTGLVGRISGVNLTRTTLHVDEDAPCQTLPNDIFKINHKGNKVTQILDTWFHDMREYNKVWLDPMSIVRAVQRLVVHYHSTRQHVLKYVKATVAIENGKQGDNNKWINKHVAILLYRGQLLSEHYRANVLTTPTNLKLCVARDYSGSFSVRFTPIWMDGRPSYYSLKLIVQVKPRNDPPRLKHRDITEGLEDVFTFPRVPLVDENDPPYSVPELPVSDLSSALFKDPDARGPLGLAVVGFIRNRHTVEGHWMMSVDGSIWTDVPPAPKVSMETAEFDCAVQFLYTTGKLRFMPKFENYTWTDKESPGLAIKAWDQYNVHKLSDSSKGTIALRSCMRALNPQQISDYCGSGEDSAFSRVTLVVPLRRRGCDNIPGSARSTGPCGCGKLARQCLDCNGDSNGGAKRDVCGQCTGGLTGITPATAIDCDNTKCAAANKLTCNRKRVDKDELDKMCPAVGEVPNIAYDASNQRCNRKCVPRNVPPPEDKCGVMCGDDACVDCSGVVNGTSLMNLCGQCRKLATLNQGCRSIGHIQPRSVFAWPAFNIIMRVSPVVAINVTAYEISCELKPKDTSVELVAVPTVTSTQYNPDDSTLTLTVNGVQGQSLSSKGKPHVPTGQFSVQCDINGRSVSTAEHEHYLTIYDHPEVSEIAPSSALASDLSKVSIKAPHFEDTGVVYCIVPCWAEDEDEGACRGYRGVAGRRVDSTTVVCNARRLRRNWLDEEMAINVILGEKDSVDLSSLPSPVILTVRVPPPEVQDATLNKHGCKSLRIRFTVPVTSSRDHACANYFDTNTMSSLRLEDAVCILSRGHILVRYNTSIPVGATLVFKDDVITRRGSSLDGSYVTGSVMVSADKTSQGRPIVKIARRRNKMAVVGCKPVLMKTWIWNMGCWDIDTTWSVTVDGADPANTTIAEAISKISSTILGKRHFRIYKHQLLPGTAFTFTMSWSAGGYSGTDHLVLMADKTPAFSLDIVGLKDNLDVTKRNKFKVKIKTCKRHKTRFSVYWSLTSSVAESTRIKPRVHAFIPEGVLYPGTTYTVTCTVEQGTETIIESMNFTTQIRPIRAAIEYNNDRSSDEREHAMHEQMVLTCVDVTGNRPRNDDVTSYMWTCKDNTYGEDDMDFKPCLSVTNGITAPLQMTGETIRIGSVDRQRRPESWPLRQTWTVIMKRGLEEYVAERTFTFKHVREELKRSIIVSRSRRSERLSLNRKWLYFGVHCKRATSYRWRSDSTEYAEVDLSAIVKKGYIKRSIPYNDRLFTQCGIYLNLADANLVAGETYRVTLEVYNEQGEMFTKNTMKNTMHFYLEAVSWPRPGTVEVVPEEFPVVAMTTPVSISLFDWWDPEDDDLKCRFYAHNEADPTHVITSAINSLASIVDEAVDSFTLPEGVFKFEASCCNAFGRCANAFASKSLKTIAAPESAIMEFIGTLPDLINRDEDTLLQTIESVLTTTNKRQVPLDQANEDVVKYSINAAVQQKLATAISGHVRSDSLETLVKSVLVMALVPKYVTDETRQSVWNAFTEIAREAARRVPSSDSRRRRSLTYSEPMIDSSQDITEDEVTILLNGLSSTYPDEVLMEDANTYRQMIDDVLVAMCQSHADSAPWTAQSDLVTVWLDKRNTTGVAGTTLGLSCESCHNTTAKVNFGRDIEAMFEGTWECSSDATCDDVCIATAQISVDWFSPSVGVPAPLNRRSDLVVLQLINPETNEYITNVTELSSAVETTIILKGEVDLDTFEFKCLMLSTGLWSDTQCTTSIPVFDDITSTHNVTCACTELGVVGVFQILKPEEFVTIPPTTTVSTTAITTPTTAAPSDVTEAPSKRLSPKTKHVIIMFWFTNDYDTEVAALEVFTLALKSELITRTGFLSSSFMHFEIKKGSIIVSFELHASGNQGDPTLGQMVHTIETLLPTMTFTGNTGGALTLQADSFSFTEIQNEPVKKVEKESDADNTSGTSGLVRSLLSSSVFYSCLVLAWATRH